MKKSLTLIELLITMVLISVVVLSIYGLYNLSFNIFKSSDRRAEVVNELSYVLDHIDKSVYLGTGWVDRPVVDVTTTGAPDFTVEIFQDLDANGDPLNTPADETDDRIARYVFHTGNNIITFEIDNLGPETLTNRLVDPDNNLDIDTDDGELVINDLSFRYNPAEAEDSKFNPEVSISEQRFHTLTQSVN
jgi:hypothetical protein